jgi:hypothetical protein
MPFLEVRAHLDYIFIDCFVTAELSAFKECLLRGVKVIVCHRRGILFVS